MLGVHEILMEISVKSQFLDKSQFLHGELSTFKGIKPPFWADKSPTYRRQVMCIYRDELLGLAKAQEAPVNSGADSSQMVISGNSGKLWETVGIIK